MGRSLNSTPMGVNSVSFGSSHVLCTPMGCTWGHFNFVWLSARMMHPHGTYPHAGPQYVW